MNSDTGQSNLREPFCSWGKLRLLVPLAALLYAASPACAAFVAQSTISWGVGQDDIVTKTGTTTGGSYKLGSLRVQIIDAPAGIDVTTPAKEFTYKFNNTDTLGPLTRAKASEPFGSTTTVTAQADMTIVPKPANYKAGTPIPYTLTLTAKSDTGWFSPTGYATARGGDPQYISSPGVFGGMLSLGPGSSVFGTRPGIDRSEATFQLTAFGLSDPIATLDITSGNGHVNADVHFNNDPRLSFFRPGVLDPLTDLPIPISDTQVTSMLDSNPYLGTQGGTLSALNLFTFRYDLTGATLTPDAALGSSGEADAFSPSAVPEPASLTLLGFGAVSLAGYGWRRRKQMA
jgi:hypothetical protein